MLYIFRVDTGHMTTLDMNLALETVNHLKKAVAATLAIPAEKQVLLISGGESLEPDERVCKYTAGSSDTNPIFLFSMSSLESPSPPSQPAESIASSSERDLQGEVERSLALPDTINTVNMRTALAQEYVKASSSEIVLCEEVIHAQHLQHQGWAAALANLEDSVLALEKRHSRLTSTFATYLERRDHYRQVIETFDEDLHTLSKIPVLPALVSGFEPQDSGHEGSRPASCQGKNKISLLEWIQQGTNHSLEQVADSCYRSLEQLDSIMLETIEGKVSSCVEGANNNQMKEIRGLGDRLSGLEQLLLDAKKKVVEQTDLGAAFSQNQARASNLRDPSILPDLCASHRQQLLVMARNHQHITSIRKRCAKAKQELSFNLYTRLKWVMYIQRQMAEAGQQLVLYHEELRRLSKRLEVMEQIHLAPSIYIATVVEVVRRRAFSQNYRKKTTLIASTFGELHKKEVEVRTQFQEKLETHFLSSMFPGLDELPPDFATESPREFDVCLPRISLQDLENLRTEFPSIAESLSMPDRTTLSSLLTRSFSQALTPEEGTALHTLQTITDKIPGLASTNGGFVGSVSVMNRLCASEIVGVTPGPRERKKSRLDAMAASRERELASDSDSDHEQEEKTKQSVKNSAKRKAFRSLTNSVTKIEPMKLPQKGEESEQEFVTATFQPGPKEGEGKESTLNRASISSSSVDPSSSSAANTNSSAAPSSDGSLMKQQWPSLTDLQAQVDDKNREIDNLQKNLHCTETKLSNLERNIAKVLGVNKEDLNKLRDELSGIKEEVNDERQEILTMLSDVTKNMVDNLSGLEEITCPSSEYHKEKANRVETEKELELVKEKLEVEIHKLDDCNKEITIYRHQLEEAHRNLETSTQELLEERASRANEIENLRRLTEEEKKDFKSRLKTEQQEIIQKMELEHELELDNAKQYKMSLEENKSSDININLVSQLELRTNEVKDLTTRLELQDASHEEKFRQEKDTILKAVETELQEHHEKSMVDLERRLIDKHSKEIEELKASKQEEMMSRLEELRQKMIDSSQLSVDRMKVKLENDYASKMREREAELRKEFVMEKMHIEESKQEEISDAKEKIRKKSKLEMESLRSRFKMMQTAGTLERSPSVSESEFPLESPRNSMEFLSGRDFQKWEQERERLMQLNSELQAELEEIRNQVKQSRESENLRTSAEKQVFFNEAIRAAVEEKDKKICSLEAQLVTGSQAELEVRLGEMGRENQRLESELREALARQAMDGSIVNIRQLREENQQLRQHLTRSQTALVSTGKVSVSSCNPGELVLVVWSEENSNYSIYQEGTTLHFLHTDSIVTLGLQEGQARRRRYTTAEVVDKEYCQAKKAENRFRVMAGTKFYRVKCKPVERDQLSNSLASSLRMAKPL